MYRPLSALIVGLLLPLASHAANTPVTPGIEFVHHDWFLACDNTGTCRAAGYGPENADSCGWARMAKAQCLKERCACW